MHVLRPGHLPQLAVITPRIFEDDRGEFFELFNQSVWAQHGLDISTVQTNVSRSTRGVLRGLHYQWPNPQGKLVTCLEGEIYDVAVDIRPASPTFKLWHAETLSADNHKLFWIPEGFAHGFLVMSERATVCYHTTAPYSHPDDRGVSFADDEIGVIWPLNSEPLLSEKDQKLPCLRDLSSADLPTINSALR